MDCKLTEDDIKKIVEDYYRNTYDLNTTCSINVKPVFSDFHRSYSAGVTIKVEFKKRILGSLCQSEEIVTEEKLKEIIKNLLATEGHDCTNIRYDSGVNDSYDYYGLPSHIAYFNGIILEGVCDKKGMVKRYQLEGTHGS